MIRFRCKDLDIRFGRNGQEVQALRGISFESGEGEFLSVLGPSGCGKTTLLRAVAGMIEPSRGSVEWGGRMGQPKALLVYQENSLFPWMTVVENAAFGLEAAGVPKKEREEKARELLARVGMSGRLSAYPHELSLGMKQRVAVIRCFLSEPDVMLMDEPFAAVDAQMRLTLQQELLSLWEQNRSNVLFVTHDVDEALLLSDRILVLSHHPGEIVGEFRVPLKRPRTSALALEGETLELKKEILRKLGMVIGGNVNAV